MADLVDDIDPTDAETWDDLAACMRRRRARADNISYRELERWGEEHNKPLPRSTLLEVLHGRRFPRKSLLLAFVEACGVDPAIDTRWEKAWNRLNDELSLADSTVPIVPAEEQDGGEGHPEPAMPADVWEQAQDLLGQARRTAASIKADARDKARQIIARAEEQAAETRSTAEREAEQIKRDAMQRAEREVEALRKQLLLNLAEEADALEHQQPAAPPQPGGTDRQQPAAENTEARPKRWFGR